MMRQATGLARRLGQLMDALMPGECAMCGADSNAAICAACERRYRGAESLPRRCERCALRLPDGHAITDCPACRRYPPAWDHTLALGDYAPPLDRLLQALKFDAQLPLAEAFGLQLAATCRAAMAAATPALPSPCVPAASMRPLLIPVPLSRERLAERGFNQSAEIARAIARSLSWPMRTDLCVRTRDTAAQAVLPLARRQVNMRDAFAVLQPQAIAGRWIVVVDDVMTTGHTLNALALCLKRHGAARLTNLVVARTPAR